MRKYFPYLIFITALIISCTGSFFSIYGLGKLFGGHQVGATILAFSFEFGNIVTAASLKYYWKFLPGSLKFPLIIIVVVLTILTSMGIYGYLSDGYQKTAMKDEIVSKKSNLVNIKKTSYETRVSDNKKEIETINLSLQELSKSYTQNTQTEQIDRRTGQKITNVIVGNKKGLDNQLNVLNNRKIKLDSINSCFLDSIQRLELVMIELQNSNETNSELGPLKYLSGLINKPMNQIVNWLILLIVFVFQPLALLLILTAMFAFKNNHYLVRKKKENRTSAGIKKAFTNLADRVKNLIKKPIIQTPTELTPQIKITSKRTRKKIEELKSTNNEEESKPEPEAILTEELRQYDTMPVEIVEAPKQVKTSKKKKTIEIEPKIEPILTEEIVQQAIQPQPKKSRTRKVVDTNLTADIANHISQSLSDKKK